MPEKQACAAVGQCKLMMNYHKLFAEYGQIASQVLLTKYSIDQEKSYHNVKNTFQELLNYGSIPIVNENDAIATDEIEFGENDTLSAIVSAITNADLLILLTDIDGLYTDDPFQNENAKLIDVVTNEVKQEVCKMAKKSSDSDVGTGGMYTKVLAANIINPLGIDMMIASGKDPNILNKMINGEKHGTLFVGRKEKEEEVRDYLISKLRNKE